MSSECACSPVWSPLGLVVVWNLGGDETADMVVHVEVRGIRKKALEGDVQKLMTPSS